MKGVKRKQMFVRYSNGFIKQIEWALFGFFVF